MEILYRQQFYKCSRRKRELVFIRKRGKRKMFARIIGTLIVMAMLCTAAFTLGSSTAKNQADKSGIPPQHPLSLALRFRQDLGLEATEVAKLEQLRTELAKEFAPFHEQAESIQKRMEALQKSGSNDQEAAIALKKEAEQLGTKVQPLFEKYANEVISQLSNEQREILMKLSEAHAHDSDTKEFALMFIISEREQLAIAPQQFTKLQYLQADFIRAFAPLREQVELLQLKEKAKGGEEPTPEFREQVAMIQKQVSDLQDQFSKKAIQEVLLPNQRAKLEELQGGQHRSGQNGR